MAPRLWRNRESIRRTGVGGGERPPPHHFEGTRGCKLLTGRTVLAAKLKWRKLSHYQARSWPVRGSGCGNRQSTRSQAPRPSRSTTQTTLSAAIAAASPSGAPAQWCVAEFWVLRRSIYRLRPEREARRWRISRSLWDPKPPRQPRSESRRWELSLSQPPQPAKPLPPLPR